MDPSGKSQYFGFDLMGRRTSFENPDRGKWTYAYRYDTNNTTTVTTITGPDNQTHTSTTDGFNRIKQVEATKSICVDGNCTTDSQVSTFTYDNAPNGKGRLFEATRGGITERVSGYDPMGRITGEQKSYPGLTPFETTYDYDEAGRLETVTYPDQFSVTYTYLEGTNLPAMITTGNSQLIAELSSYTPSGHPGTVIYGNGVVTEYDYNPVSLMLDHVKTSKDATILQEWTYTYYPSGDMRQKTDTQYVYTYTYDPLHRLTGETKTLKDDGRLQGSLSYTYDLAGNLTTKTGNNALTYNYTDVTRPNRLTSVTLGTTTLPCSYDASGNMTSVPSLTGNRRVTYGADGLPDSVDTTRFTYDAFGTRAKSEKGHVYYGTTATLYVSPLYEVEGTTPTKYITLGGTRIAVVKGQDVHYLHQDHLGSTTALTDKDGNKTDSGHYAPFGMSSDTDGTKDTTPYLYTGQELDDTGLYNYKARLYSAELGRFISPDPVIANAYNPQGLNPYSYVNNNPVMYTDPSGMMTPEGSKGTSWYEDYEPWIDTGIGGAIGLVQSSLSGMVLGAYSRGSIGAESMWGLATGIELVSDGLFLFASWPGNAFNPKDPDTWTSEAINTIAAGTAMAVMTPSILGALSSIGNIHGQELVAIGGMIGSAFDAVGNVCRGASILSGRYRWYKSEGGQVKCGNCTSLYEAAGEAAPFFGKGAVSAGLAGLTYTAYFSPRLQWWLDLPGDLTLGALKFTFYTAPVYAAGGVAAGARYAAGRTVAAGRWGYARAGGAAGYVAATAAAAHGYLRARFHYQALP
jgi:RHS repeat-associated protein